ncbi:MAG TPA: cysteine dioxygenase [Acidocella sp.]|nr:cysteine dioxygenase [Acidocella sp.]
MANIDRLRGFIALAVQAAEKHGHDEAAALAEIKPALAALVARDDFLPEDYARPHPQYYQQYLLYGDPLDRLSIVSFVWGPGQKTPVHNHRTWGLVGILRGAELSTDYGKENGKLVPSAVERLEPGRVVAVSPSIGDVHQIANAYDDRVSISIHVYGGNIGRIKREVFVPDTGEVKAFVSGYANAPTPNLWAPAA